jgi:NH3-dependent NAD+ synthetase
MIEMVREIRSVLDEAEKDGVLIRVSNTLNSMVLASILVKAIGSDRIKAVYFNVRRRFGIPVYLRKLLDYLRIRYEYIEIRSLTNMIIDYTQGYAEISANSIVDTIVTLLLNETSTKENLIVVGEVDKTMWMTGIFNPIYSKSMDILPLTHIYSSQLQKVASELRILPYTLKNETHPYTSMLLKRVGNVSIEYIDAILYGITANKTDSEILKELENRVSIDTVRKIRHMVNTGFYKRNGPIIEP